MKTFPAGITVSGHGRNRTVITVRREPETIYDLSDGFISGLGAFDVIFGAAPCPCCGRSLFRGAAWDAVRGGLVL
jgi:hypothetical protein